MNTPSLESSSIEYNSTRYADCYPLGKLASFNHGPLAKGPINREAIRKLIPELNEQAAKETEAIRFEAKRIENTLVGGSCSAIALKIAGLAVDLVASSKKEEEVASLVKEEVEKFEKLTRGERKSLRTLQAAFNTIGR